MNGEIGYPLVSGRTVLDGNGGKPLRLVGVAAMDMGRHEFDSLSQQRG
jgi:hypothetical protein